MAAVITTVLIVVGSIAGAGGVGLGVHGGVKLRRASKRIKAAKEISDKNTRKLEDQNVSTCTIMDALGRNEMEALKDFEQFSSLIEKINERPNYDSINPNYDIPKFDPAEIKRVSVGASALVSGLGGAALGTAGAFAASSATTAAVVAVGSASTGALLNTLHGAALANATLAAIGGGSLAAGGGGMALGTIVLGAASLGVGLLIGGVIFTLTGSSIQGKAATVEKQVQENEKKINEVCRYLKSLLTTADKYSQTLSKMRHLYSTYLKKMKEIIDRNAIDGRVSWLKLNDDERILIDNTILIVGIIYNMCKVSFVKETAEDGLNKINLEEIKKAEAEANKAMVEL